MAARFNPPPGWPSPPTSGWRPAPGWAPDPSWPPAPAGWQFYVDDGGDPDTALVTYSGTEGTDVVPYASSPTYVPVVYPTPWVYGGPAAVVVLTPKSVGLAAVLAFFFGPLGMLYSTVLGAVVMFAVELVVGVATLGLGLFFTWPLCMIWAVVAANHHNDRMLAASARHYQRPR